MASITVRNLDDSLKSLLRIQSAKHGHSMQEEVRQILRQALLGKAEQTGLGTQISQRFAEIGGLTDLEDIHVPRSLPRTQDLS